MSRVLNFVSAIWSSFTHLLSQFFSVFGDFVGRAKSSEYFLDFQSATSINKSEPEQSKSPESAPISQISTQNRRVPTTQMSDFLSMAEQIKKRK